MMATLMMTNCIVYDDVVSYFYDVVDTDHQSAMMKIEESKNANVIDYDYCLFEIVCDDDNDDFYDDDGDVYATFSSSSFSCVW